MRSKLLSNLSSQPISSMENLTRSMEMVEYLTAKMRRFSVKEVSMNFLRPLPKMESTSSKQRTLSSSMESISMHSAMEPLSMKKDLLLFLLEELKP